MAWRPPLCAALALGLAACGGEERQDENEPEGEFRVDVVDATFPAKQKLAKRSELSITVRNAGNEEVPNIAVTVDGFDVDLQDEDLADPSRPDLRDQRQAEGDRGLRRVEGPRARGRRHRLRQHVGARARSRPARRRPSSGA